MSFETGRSYHVSRCKVRDSELSTAVTSGSMQGHPGAVRDTHLLAQVLWRCGNKLSLDCFLGSNCVPNACQSPNQSSGSKMSLKEKALSRVGHGPIPLVS